MKSLEKVSSMVTFSNTSTNIVPSKALKRDMSTKNIEYDTSLENSRNHSQSLRSISFNYLRFSSKADSVDLRTF